MVNINNRHILHLYIIYDIFYLYIPFREAAPFGFSEKAFVPTGRTPPGGIGTNPKSPRPERTQFFYWTQIRLLPCLVSPSLSITWISVKLELLHVQGVFKTVPPTFQYQNEKQVAANQGYFVNKFSM